MGSESALPMQGSQAGAQCAAQLITRKVIKMAVRKIQTVALDCDLCGSEIVSLPANEVDQYVDSHSVKLSATLAAVVFRTPANFVPCHSCSLKLLRAARSLGFVGVARNSAGNRLTNSDGDVVRSDVLTRKNRDGAVIASGATAPNTSDTGAANVRAWAKANGIAVGDRGKMAPEVYAAFNAAAAKAEAETA